ncbi:hypothetical protein JTB14_008486 [Gonioctena quinquepunctata]|nr:hypothetical protein JTB14_008486 [Gonioctena quinquepunctata]
MEQHRKWQQDVDDDVDNSDYSPADYSNLHTEMMINDVDSNPWEGEYNECNSTVGDRVDDEPNDIIVIDDSDDNETIPPEDDDG